MILLQEADYGSLAPVVKAVGVLLASASAISLTWKRRASWEPSEQDVKKGAERVAGVLNAVALVVIWVQLADVAYRNQLTDLAIGFAIATLAFLLAYGLLISVYTYAKVIAPAPNALEEVRIIGGFWLTTRASELRKTGKTVQEILKGAAYSEDHVWPRLGRALAKMTFVVSYIGLVLSGTVAISCAAILFLLTPRNL